MTAPDWRAELSLVVADRLDWSVVEYADGKVVKVIVRITDETTAKHIAASWRMRNYLVWALDMVEDRAAGEGERKACAEIRALLASLEETE